MKQASRLFCCLLLALAYVFSYAGFGIHTCHEDGSRHFVWMLGDVSCEAIHHHSHDADHDHHHDKDCCTTQVYVLTDAQDSDSGIDRAAGAPDAGLLLVFETPCFAQTLPAHLLMQISHAPPLPERADLSLLSVWLI